MKKILRAASVAAITISVIVVTGMVFAACTSNANTVETRQINVIATSQEIQNSGHDENHSADEYIIGSTGPAGGIIFYDKGHSSDGWRYLEAAPAETEFRTGWGAFGHHVSGTETDIGNGKRNTGIIVDYLNRIGETGSAAQICDNLVVNGFGDWFLPCIDELMLMHANLHSNGLGGFSDAWDAWWWSSSQYDDHHAWYMNSYGGLFNNHAKPNTGSVRAIRAF